MAFIIITSKISVQIATVEVPEEHMGSVVELLGKRRGQMFDMQGVGFVDLSLLFYSPKQKFFHSGCDLINIFNNVSYALMI